MAWCANKEEVGSTNPLKRGLTTATVLALFGLGCYLGSGMPDLDQHTNLLLHRSILTHGLLGPLLVSKLLGGCSVRSLQWFAAGFALGVAIHLAADLFPKAWTGFALISLPFYGWLPAPASITWLVCSVVVCLGLAVRPVLWRPKARWWLD